MPEATRDQLLQEIQASQRKIVAILASMENMQDWQREPVEWSFRYVAAHLANVEQQHHLRRIVRIASGENPQFRHYSNSAADFGQCDLRESLRRWVSTRQELVNFVRNLSNRQLRHTGIHQTVGVMTVLDALQEILEQDRGNFRHVCQLIVDYYEEA